MFGKVLIGSLVSAVVLMIWGFLYWVVLSPAMGVIDTLPNDSLVAQALRANIQHSGLYVYPYAGNCEGTPNAEQRMMSQFTDGPIFRISYHHEGVDPASPMVFIFGFIHYFVSALLVGSLLLMALPLRPTFGSRLSFVVLAGIFATVFVNFSDPIWYYAPWKYHLFSGVYHVLSWVLGGAVLAAMVKPRQTA